MPETVSLAYRDGLALLELRRPDSGNALDPSLVADCLGALDDVEGSDAHTLLIEGAGKGFCGGFDLSGLASETDGSLLLRFVRIELLLQRVASFPKLTACFAHRFAYGAGADLFCACDLRFADPATRFQFPGVAFGLALGTRRLADLVGRDRALAMLSRDAPLTAAEAGAPFVTECLPAEERPQLRERLALQPPAIDPKALPTVLDRLRRVTPAEDMHALVASAAVPGLKARIETYRASKLAGEAPARHANT